MTTSSKTQQVSALTRTGQAFFKAWQFIVRAHPSITDIEMRRQSRLLAGLMVALFTTSAIASILLTATSEVGIPATVFRLLPVMAFLAVYYAINRSGHYRIASTLFLIQNFMTVHAFPLATGDIAWLEFASMNLILTALLMPVRVTLFVFVASMVAQILLGRFDPHILEISNIGLFVVYLVTSSMVIVFINHRNRLERDRQRELQAANDRLRESEAILEQRVEERTRELVIAKERAEQADQIKSQFLASMSHELRTPLNAILNFTEMMGLGLVDPVTDKQKDVLDKSLASGKHLLSLINDVLDVAKMQSGMLTLFVEKDLDLGKEIETIYATIQPMIHNRPIKLTLDLNGGLPMISGDKRRIRQVLLNLVSNAIKFTEQGSVTISAHKQSEGVLVTVTDSGPGISAEDQKVIFEPFIQTEHGIQHAGGTGLGLPISQAIVEAHGGRLWVESSMGKGSKFYFSLPNALSDVPVAAGG
jgi:signal transduction histidine kinase